MPWSKSEFKEKTDRIRNLLYEEKLKAILVTSQTNFVWLTGGRPYINTAVEKACADLLITEKSVYLLSNNIEADRLYHEELSGLPLEKVAYNWWDTDALPQKIHAIVGDGQVATDIALGNKFARLRWNLSVQEQVRYLETGRDVGLILEETAFAIQPGQTESTIADQIRTTALNYGVQANVALVAVDDRTFKYRHPVPTAKKLDKYAMLVISGQKHGLYASATRLVHFGSLPADLSKRYEAVLTVEAAFIAATVAGTPINEIFRQGIQAYEAAGFVNEWHYHHQGGLTGYNSREIKADMVVTEKVKQGQAFAWNPTIAGVKVEDTFIISSNGPRIITASAGFATVEVLCNGITLKRPAILIR